MIFLAGLMKNDLLKPALATGITNTLIAFQDTVGNLERICNTPLPFAYQAHLRMSLWYVVVSSVDDRLIYVLFM